MDCIPLRAVNVSLFEAGCILLSTVPANLTVGRTNDIKWVALSCSLIRLLHCAIQYLHLTRLSMQQTAVHAIEAAARVVSVEAGAGWEGGPGHRRAAVDDTRRRGWTVERRQSSLLQHCSPDVTQREVHGLRWQYGGHTVCAMTVSLYDAAVDKTLSDGEDR